MEANDSNEEKKRLVLLDAHAILHRAYHALPDFSTAKGQPTGALYGLSAMLIKIIEDLKPDYIAACYDLAGPTYRHEAFKDYKAQRKKADDDLVAQMKSSRNIFTAMDIPVYDKQGFEADDILGTIVQQLTVRDRTPRLVSPLVVSLANKSAPVSPLGASPFVSLANRSRKSGEPSRRSGAADADSSKSNTLEIIIASGDMDTMQLVSGERVRVYTLKKGIKDTIMYDEKAVNERFGFGPLLIPDYKGLRGDPSDNIPGIKGVGEKTATILITAFGSIENIYRELEAGHDAKFVKAGISPRIIQLLKDNKEEAEFSKMLATIRRDVPIEFRLPEKSFKESLDLKKVGALWRELEFRTLGQRLEKAVNSMNAPRGSASVVISETEKKNRKSRSAELFFNLGNDNTCASEGGGASNGALFNPISKDEIGKTAIALWLVNSNRTDPTLEDIMNFSDAETFEQAEKNVFAELDKRNSRKVYEDIELPIIPVVRAMSEKGVKIDKEILARMSKRYHAELSKLEKKIWDAAEVEFNINSPKQLGEILFDKLGLKTKNPGKTEGGARSTKESELEKMRDMHPIVPHIFEYRELQKLLSTYIDAIPPLLDKDNRLHARFIQAGSMTGRMASKDPGIQNIPVKTELGKAIRDAFIAEKGFVLASLDYSQIELRIAAFLSGDEKLIGIFKSGKDVHAGVAASVFKVPENEVTPEMRHRAKVINFGILYGMGVLALKQNLSVSREEAQNFLNDYFATFSTLANYLNKVKSETARRGYTETFFGRRRYFEGINSKIPFIRASAERMAVNAPIQGTSADITKMAMKRVNDFIVGEKLENEVSLILQVHDELVYEIREDLAEKIVPEIKRIMENVIEPDKIYGIHLAVGSAVGKNWGEL